MRLYVIGQSEEKPGYTPKFYKLYDADKGKCVVVTRKDIKETMIKKHIPIAGLKISESINMNNSGMLLFYALVDEKMFRTERVDKVKANGQLINAPKTWVLVDAGGVQETAKYRCVNSEGEVRVFDHKTVCRLAEAESICGLNASNGIVKICKCCRTVNMLNRFIEEEVK